MLPDAMNANGRINDRLLLRSPDRKSKMYRIHNRYIHFSLYSAIFVDSLVYFRSESGSGDRHESYLTFQIVVELSFLVFFGVCQFFPEYTISSLRWTPALFSFLRCCARSIQSRNLQMKLPSVAWFFCKIATERPRKVDQGRKTFPI